MTAQWQCDGTELWVPVVKPSTVMRLLILLLLLSSTSSLAAMREVVLVVDQTLCWNCSEPQGCREEVQGVAQTLLAVNWTLQRLDQLGLLERETYSEYQSRGTAVRLGQRY